MIHTHGLTSLQGAEEREGREREREKEEQDGQLHACQDAEGIYHAQCFVLGTEGDTKERRHGPTWRSLSFKPGA